MLLNQPSEVLLEQIILLDVKSISQLKLVNKSLYKFINKNKSYIYKKKLEQEYGDWISNPFVLHYCLQYGINIYELRNESAFKNILRKMIFSNQTIFNFLITYIHKKNSIDKFGNTILMSLITNLHSNMESHNDSLIKKIKFLLNQNPNVKIQNNYKQTALIYACKFCKNLEIIQKIIELGGDVNYRDIYGWNAIMYAIVFNNKNVIDYLSSISKLSTYDVIELILFKKDQFVYINSDYQYDIAESEDLTESSFFEVDEEMDMEDHFQTNFLKNIPGTNKQQEIITYITLFQIVNSENLPMFISSESDFNNWLDRTIYLMNIEKSESCKTHLITKIYNTLIYDLDRIYYSHPDIVKNLLYTLYTYTFEKKTKENIYYECWENWVIYSYSILYNLFTQKIAR
jgi:hypothetical protein